MKKRIVEWICIIVLGSILFLPASSYAAGPPHGAKGAGMGTAFLAIADDPSAIIVNPAGLIKSKGTNIYSGVTPLILSTTYTSPLGESEDTEFQVFFPPHLFISSDFGMEDIVLGLGLHSPFGIGGRKWSRTGPTRYISTESTTATFDINPTISYQALPKLSIGFGLNYMKAISEAQSMTDQSLFGAGDGGLIIESDGDGFGYNLGLLYTHNERLSLAFAYRSEIKIDTKGTAKLNDIAPALQSSFGGSQFESETHSTLIFPDVWSFGIAYSPTNKLTIAFDFELVRWSSSEKIVLDFETEVHGLFTDITTVLDYKDSKQFKVGAEYRPNDRLSLRGGYAYIETFVPDHTLTPANPDSDQHNFSIGFGYKFKKFILDAFYNIGLFEKRIVNNSILSGEYVNTTHSAGMSLGYRFR